MCYSWGNNNHGQLGLGDEENRPHPQLVKTFDQKSPWKIYEVACGAFHTALLTPSFTSTSNPTTDTTTHRGGDNNFQSSSQSEPPLPPPPPGLAWKLIKLPVSVISGSLGLITGAIGLGLWAAGGVLSYSLGFMGLGSGPSSSASAPLVSVSAATTEAMDFVAAFERDYGNTTKPNFVSEGFMDALQRSRNSFKLLFVYLHSPDHPDTPSFCRRTLCSETFVEFVNQNFVCWGGSIRASEGFKMSNSLKASRFPFCALVMAATNQRIALLQQVEGPKSPEEMLVTLQRVLEESSPVLVAARLDAEERRNNMRLREEQDAAYRAALEADQARERQRREEEERLAREAAEAERKRKEEEEARERAAQEAAEKQAALAKLRQEKAQSLGEEPEKGPNVTQVLVRFPNGVRKERRFNSTVTIQSLYDYVDSLDCLEAESYSLVSNFPLIEANIRNPRWDLMYPTTRLICLENSHANSGGRCLSVEYTDRVGEVAKKHGLKLHIDGARIFNASIALGVPVDRLVKAADSVSVCLSKGLGAPVGSVIVGSKNFITKAKRLRKTLGGGMRQIGILCAASLVALKENVGKLESDHKKTRLLADGLNEIEGLRVNPCSVETNIIFIDIEEGSRTTAEKICKYLEERGILLLQDKSSRLRVVLHFQISASDVQYTLSCFQQALQIENGN